jgi:hypothetical protein
LAEKNKQAQAAGPLQERLGLQDSAEFPLEPLGTDVFGGLDLSKISPVATASKSEWNEDMPTLFYEPEDEMTIEEQEEADPVMKMNLIDQAMNEFSNSKWPGVGAALKQVVLIVIFGAFTAFLVIGADRFLREFYMSIGFIPTKEDIANYASRFNGIELPSGWTDTLDVTDAQPF